MTECLSACQSHKTPCTTEYPHVLHKHAQPVGPLMMTHYWMNEEAQRVDL